MPTSLEHIQQIYRFLLYTIQGNNPISWPRLKKHAEVYLKDNSTYDTILPLLYLGLIDVQYVRNGTFYFMPTSPHKIYNTTRELEISPSLLLPEFSRSAHSLKKYKVLSILQLFSPVSKCCQQIQPSQREIRASRQERWNGKNWKESPPYTPGLYRDNYSSPATYYLFQDRDHIFDTSPRDFLYNSAKTISYFLAGEKPLTIDTEKHTVQIQKYIYLLVMRALWAESLLNSDEKPLAWLENQLKAPLVFENISAPFMKQLQRIFKGGY